MAGSSPAMRERRLKRNIVMLLPRVLERLVAQRRKRPGDPLAGRMRHVHLVEKPPFGGNTGIGETLLVIADAPRNPLGILELRSVQDLDRALGAHDGDLGGRP